MHYWATTAYFDTGHDTWVQVQRAGKPNMTTFFDFATGSAKVADYNGTAPAIDLIGRPAHPATDPASGIWGQVRDNIAAVVEAGGTHNRLPHAFPTARAYGTWAADGLLPNVIKMIVNQDFSSGLTPGPVLDYFPYLSPPPGS